MGQGYSVIQLPFSEHPTTSRETVGPGITIGKTEITLPSGAKIFRKESSEARDSDGTFTDITIGNRTVSAMTSPDSQYISIKSKDAQGVTTSYSYSNKNGIVEYTLNTYGPGLPASKKTISRDEFINSASGTIGDVAQSWTTQLSKNLPAASKQAGTPQLPIVSSSATKDTRLITITTDGVCTIVGKPGDAQDTSAFCNQQPVESQKMPPQKPIMREGIAGPHAAAEIKGNPTLKKTLPAIEVDGLAQHAAGGGPILIDHVGTPDKPNLQRSLAARQRL